MTAKPNLWPLEANGHLLAGRHEASNVADVSHILWKREKYPMIADLGVNVYDLNLSPCEHCDQQPALELDDQARVVRALTPCPHPDGVSVTFRVRFTSGKVVVADDLRDAYGPHEPEHSYNSALGQAEVALAAAAAGLASGYVGNTCPDLVELTDGTYAIVVHDPDVDPLRDDTGKPAVARVLTCIVTDVWSYAMADLDDYLARGGQLAGHQRAVVDLPPGTYEFTNHTGVRGHDPHESFPAALVTFRRVED